MNVLVNENSLSAIASAIRSKNGTTNRYKPAQMGPAIIALPNKADYSWHQCPEAVRNYLAYITEHPYSSDDYTSSVIGNFAPTPAIISNTKPIGYTVDGRTFYNNVPNNATPYATNNVAGTLTALDQVRWINSHTSNMRDLGGWTCDGGTIKYGLIYRSGEINSQDENLIINELGIKTEVDLTADGTPAFGGGKMRFVCAPEWAMYSLTPTNTWKTNLRAIFDSVKYGEAVIFHCSMGADRTGTLACVIEGLLGVPQNYLDADYELTSFFTERRRDTDYQGGGGAKWERLINQIKALSGATIRDKCVNFVASLGFTAEEINAFRSAMIDGTPETVTPTISTYTVTNTLSNVTTNNSAVSANQYQPYRATLTPSEGYVFDEVDVTMGGMSVKSTSYTQIEYPIKKGEINIENVTGNIVVSATAVQSAPSYTNLADPTSTEWLTNQRISTSSYSANTGSDVTNWIPCSYGDTIRVKGLNIDAIVAGIYARWAFADSNKTRYAPDINGFHQLLNTGGEGSYDAATGIYTFPAGRYIRSGDTTVSTYTDIKYIRLCGTYTSEGTSADVIITVNEEIA